MIGKNPEKVLSNDIFIDPVLTAAIVDRLTLKAFLINIEGKSYRMKEKERMDEK